MTSRCEHHAAALEDVTVARLDAGDRPLCAVETQNPPESQRTYSGVRRPEVIPQWTRQSIGNTICAHGGHGARGSAYSYS